MTLIPFPPTALDDLALRLLDVAATLRTMAHLARETGVSGFQLHGNKAEEWLDHLEQWACEGRGRLDSQIHREQGARRARQGQRARPTRPDGKTTSRRKTKS